MSKIETSSKITTSFVYSFIFLSAFWLLPRNSLAQANARLTLDLDQPGAAVSPTLYGLMTEEINYSYDGGLYAELIRNRNFRDNNKTPDHWSVIQEQGGVGSIVLDNRQGIDEELPVTLRLNVATPGRRVGIANEGYWGIPVQAGTLYRGSFYAKALAGMQKPLTVSIESEDGKIQYASASITGLDSQWRQYTFSFTTAKDIVPTTAARFVIAAQESGTYWFSLVSLFPPTYNDRPNGNRTDIMQLLAAMKPSFLRFPGGNYLEGEMFSQRFDWKKTIGPLQQRPGHNSPWRYRSTDGMGLLEFLEWCEDLKMEPLLAVFAGYTLNKDYLDSGALLQPFVEEALEEIEYATGSAGTKWGAIRARDGHPEPFHLSYIEIGNEDGFDASGSYARRYVQFYNAIKAKYPQLQIISTLGGRDPLGARVKAPARGMEVIDEHYYRNAWEMEEDAAHYDNYSRSGPKIFVGEWATREGAPTTNFNAALGDAAWMTGMERNSDLVVMSCYAPLFVNVNPGGMQWKSDLIGYNALSSYGSPSYYAQKMFSNYIGNRLVPIDAGNIPTQLRGLSAKDSANGVTARQIPVLFYVATRNDRTGKIYLKVVNTAAAAQKIDIDLKGKMSVKAQGFLVQLKADAPEETNTIQEPEKITPHVSGIKGIGRHFSQTFPPYSITILQMETK